MTPLALIRWYVNLPGTVIAIGLFVVSTLVAGGSLRMAFFERRIYLETTTRFDSWLFDFYNAGVLFFGGLATISFAFAVHPDWLTNPAGIERIPFLIWTILSVSALFFLVQRRRFLHGDRHPLCHTK